MIRKCYNKNFHWIFYIKWIIDLLCSNAAQRKQNILLEIPIWKLLFTHMIDCNLLIAICWLFVGIQTFPLGYFYSLVDLVISMFCYRYFLLTFFLAEMQFTYNTTKTLLEFSSPTTAPSFPDISYGGIFNICITWYRYFLLSAYLAILFLVQNTLYSHHNKTSVRVFYF